MTLDEKLGQLVQRTGGRSKALNSRLDDSELGRVRAGTVGSYLHVAGAEPLGRLDTVRYRDLPITPLFPFGHGLSYSEFRYSDLAQSVQSVEPGERIDISISVENTGGVPSDEVVQLYVRDPVASVARPMLELRGFKRIELGAGQRKRVTFSLTPEQLAFWSPRGQWLIEAGRIDYWIGASSADLRANGSFEISKTHMGTAPAAALPTRVIVSN